MTSQIIRLRNIKRALKINTSKVTDQALNYVIGGRVDSIRPYKSFNFINLIDGSTNEHLQVVIKKNLIKKPDLGSYIICQGNIVPSRGSQQAIEFKVNELNFVGHCDPNNYVLAQDKGDLSDDLYRRNLHLRPRIERFRSLLRVRSELELSLHMIFKQMDFFRVHTPTLTGNDSEASSDLFKVQREGKESYFDGKDVYLITSAQLHLECLASSLSRVYCLAPCFRAENSQTRRHLCEFYMLEAEESDLDSLEQLMNRVESIIKFSAQYLYQVSDYQSDFTHLIERNSHLENFHKLADSKYIRMTYEEALRILNNEVSSNLEVDGATSNSPRQSQTKNTRPNTSFCNISRLHEKKLLEYCNNVPIFITNYPKELKPFYMRCDEQNKFAECFDLIAPIGGEICGGSLREHDLDRLAENLSLAKLQLENSEQQECLTNNFNWYLDLRRSGTFPHGGFGIGFERLIQAMTGIHNIKDTIAFPRWAGHCPM